MPRNDLLALTADDLASLTNRGTVKRAVRELETKEVTGTLAEDAAGTVTAKWSDDVTCTLPGSKTASDATCTCIATVLCRHVVRTILAYQAQQHAQAGTAEGTPPTPQPWDPGTISDTALEVAFKKPALAAAKARFDEGLLIELVRSAKPTARFHQLGSMIRFIVPGDLRYTHCDCNGPAPCSHVPLAIWAFRMLAPDKSAGLVTTQQTAFPVPADLLDAGERLLLELAHDGISGLTPGWKDRVLRLAARCEAEELIWPAQTLLDLVEQYEKYAAHDARFAPEHVADLVGEWLIRADAIRSGTAAAPQLLIRGSKADTPMDLGGGRFVGLGCGIHHDRGGVDLTAYLQDADTGTVMGITRSFADPPKDSPEPPKSFHKLAQTPVVAQAALAAVGAGQMIASGGKRTADYRLIIGRSRASVTPQAFAWESLRAPTLAEDFQELRARLEMLPIASLRPRHIAENLHVCAVAQMLGAQFDAVSQSVQVLIEDARREKALLVHPYLHRGQEGVEALMAALADKALRLRFVSGNVRQTSGGLLIHPIMLVFEGPKGRLAVQPWIDRLGNPAKDPLPPPKDSGPSVGGFPQEIRLLLMDLLIVGLRRADPHTARAWDALAQHGRSLGYSRLLHPVAALTVALAQKSATVRWSPEPAMRAALHLALLTKLAQDLG
jgi:hypothetical protein